MAHGWDNGTYVAFSPISSPIDVTDVTSHFIVNDRNLDATLDALSHKDTEKDRKCP